MVRKPQNSADVNSKFERVVRELRARFRGGVLPWGRWFSRLRGVIRALAHANWLQSGQILMKGVGRDKGFWVVDLYEGVGRDQEFRVVELCAAGATGIE